MNNVCDMAGQGAAYAADIAYAADGMLSVVSGDADTGAQDVPILPLKEKDVPSGASHCQAQSMAPCPDKAANTIPFVGSSYDVPQSGVSYQGVSALGERAGRAYPDAEATKAAERLEGRLGYRFAKRLFDIVFSLLVFALLWWLFLVVAVAIKLDSPGPVLFNQERVGKDGRTFKMYKFRSMFKDAEDRLESLQSLNEKDGPVFKIKHDPRVTRVGRFIRKTSLDELPQFLNVLLGNMSIVGPRPALPREVCQYTPYERQRLLVKPGITCYWQTRRNRDDIGFDEWVALDLLYIKQCSVWADFKLIVQTVGVVLTAQGN
ncbi:MAG: sugar transferase [Atopobiaceae bacterium]|nr:sugar transferase [Coriobacteriaceae bacterium]MDD7364702.1 sugar transferase [Olsenella sp.]MDY3900553.1 sugar transferase [Atopobiaceae bacterium]